MDGKKRNPLRHENLGVGDIGPLIDRKVGGGKWPGDDQEQESS